MCYNVLDVFSESEMQDMSNSFEEIVFSRRSIREFDPEVKISRDEMEQMIDEAATAPSACNLQPWRFVIVESIEGKKVIDSLIQLNQKQNETSSAMVIVVGDLEADRNIEMIYDRAVIEGLMPMEVAERQKKMIRYKYDVEYTHENKEINARHDPSYAAMQLMLVARYHGYDTCAIGGFDRDKILPALGITDKRYIPLIILAIGKAKNDNGFPSYRIPAKEICWYR